MIFREVKERFVDLEGQYSFPSPAVRMVCMSYVVQMFAYSKSLD